MLLEILLGAVGLAALILYFIVLKNKRDKIDLHGKHVVVTGGSSGIGRDLCIEAFKQGAHVSILARNKERLIAIKSELETIKQSNQNFASQNIQVESIDISDNFEQTKKVFAKLVENAGPVDILVNNAGIFKAIECSETSAHDYENMMRINYLGSVFCTKSVIDSMKSRKFGRIVFVSSQAGQIGVFGYTAYSATKFALRGFAEALQMEVKPYGVYVTVAYPPDTDTPGLKEENLVKPQETRLIAEGSGVYDSKVVASSIIDSLKRGSFTCTYGFNGALLAILTAGAAPAITFKEALTQIIAAPLCRVIGMVILYMFDDTVKACYKRKIAQANK